MSDRQHIEGKLREFVVAELLQGADDGDLTPTSNLLAQGLIDSISIVSLRIFVERTFQLRLPDGLEPEAFSTISTIADVIEQSRSPR